MWRPITSDSDRSDDESAFEKLAEQVVVSVSQVIESAREESAVLEVRQCLPAVMCTGQPLRDLRRDLVQDRRREQEVPRLLGLLIEDLLSEEVE